MCIKHEDFLFETYFEIELPYIERIELPSIKQWNLF